MAFLPLTFYKTLLASNGSLLHYPSITSRLPLCPGLAQPTHSRLPLRSHSRPVSVRPRPALHRVRSGTHNACSAPHFILPHLQSPTLHLHSLTSTLQFSPPTTS
ncbi:hypothetical protein VTO73DRAFT_2869 [Trametes versicolor]